MTAPAATELASDDSHPARSRADTCLAVVLIVIAFALAIISPGDLPLLDDQVSLISNALNANSQHKLADLGLGGSFGATYGPLPTQVYQLFLLTTHDLRLIVQIRAVLFVAVTVAALLSLANTLRLPRWFVGFVVCTPWVWFYYRDLWDNTFCLPLGCVAMAAYAKWFDRPTRRSAVLWSAAVVAMPLVHLAAVAMPLAMFTHAFSSRFKETRRSLGWLVVGIVIACSTSLPYLKMTVRQQIDRLSLFAAGYNSAPAGTQQSAAWKAEVRADRFRSASYALSAATLLSGRQRFIQFDERLALARVLVPIATMSLIVHGWFGVGAILAIAAILRRREAGVARSVAAVSLLALLILLFIFATMRVMWLEHYFGGVFAAIVCLAWMGCRRLWTSGTFGKILVVAPGAAVVTSTFMVVLLIHQTSGGVGIYSPTIGNLTDLSQRLGPRSNRTGYTDCAQLASSPQALWLVRRLTPAAPPDRSLADGTILIRRRNAFPGDGWLVLEFVSSPPNSGFSAFPLAPPD